MMFPWSPEEHNMTYTVTATDLSDFEADHVSQILHDYRTDLLFKKIEALAAKDEALLGWLEGHLKWHESIMAKIEWRKE